MSTALQARPGAPPRRLPSAPYRVAAAAALGTGVDVLGDPTRTHVPLCPLHALTGIWCPLCGGLRAVDALAHGQLSVAAHDNVLLVAALPLALWLWADWVVRTRAGRPGRRWSPAATLAAIGVLAVFTVVRNLPLASALHP